MSMQNQFTGVGEVYFALCKGVDTPYALGMWIRFRDDFRSFLEAEMPKPADYLDADAFGDDYAVYCFLSKWKGIDGVFDLEAEALLRFDASEAQCKLTNERIRAFRRSPIKGDIELVVANAKRKISGLLGPFSHRKVQGGCGWSSGATSSLKRRRAQIDIKLSEFPLSVSRRACSAVRRQIETDLHWSSLVLNVGVDRIGPYCLLRHCFSFSDECVVDTVPKNAKTHRIIAKEPTLNAFLQKGVGRFIRRRLARVGIDLDDQGLNQNAASVAHSDGLATLDLKAASDTVAIELVYELLPVDWAMYLDDLRSPIARLPGNRGAVQLQKFSSMGNGFTFELESLIFWALSSAVTDVVQTCSSRVWIYGDDIIVPRECAPLLTEVLDFCGFSLNKEKSYVEGEFFESCGRHYFQGRDVTPCYQKEIVASLPEAIRMANRVIRMAARLGTRDCLNDSFKGAWLAATRGPWFRFQLPLGAEGDDGFVVPADYFYTRRQDVNLGLSCKTIAFSNYSLPAIENALLALALRRGSTQSYDIFGLGEDSPEPTYGNLELPVMSQDGDESGRPWRAARNGRWVMPTWEFGLTW